MKGSPRAVDAPQAVDPVVPLNAWIARARAFAEAATAAREYQARFEMLLDKEGGPIHAGAASAARTIAEWLEQSRDNAEAKGRVPMTTGAEHLVRKATAAVRAASRAWRAA